MSLEFRALSAELVPVAMAARNFLSGQDGARKFRAESAIAEQFAYRPTLLAEASDKSLIAVEVSEGSYTAPLVEFVLDCQRESLPIRVFVAVPVGGPPGAILQLHRRARQLGIGVLEVDGRRVTRPVPALSLSLWGLRPMTQQRFPKRLRARLSQAEDTFRNGNPAKGCGGVYDALESQSRAVAWEIDRRRLWKASTSRKGHGRNWFEKHAWANVLEYVDTYVDAQTMDSNWLPFDRALWSRVRGLTPHRNESGHEPKSLRKLQARDRELRTRFEHATDCLAELVAAFPRIRG